MSNQADIGLIGLAVMGENLVLNMESRGYTCAVYNRTTARVDEFVAGRGAGKKFIAAHTLPELVGALKRPRKIMMMVKAGGPVDALMDQLIPLLEPGDILIDGGNSHYPDTARRVERCEGLGLLFVGTGVSGGEEGALKGPSIMPGGSPAAWSHVKPIFQSIAAKAPSGEPCCDWVGEGGSGHFVKMVHNGIEYGDMQMIGEAYHLMKVGLGYDNARLHATFDQWNRGELDSYLIEITRDILAFKEDDGSYLVDHILDKAGQKGTGKWTVIDALDNGQPLTLISEAVFARCISALKDERVAAAQVLPGATLPATHDAGQLAEDLRLALYASKIVSYAQGYQLMRAAANNFGWRLNYGGIALMWRGGCIIRSAFLGKIREAFDRDPELVNLLLDPFFREIVTRAQPAWRRVLQAAIGLGIPMPSIGAALTYLDGYRSAWLPANLLQAQRDYFGAHTFERIDRPRGEFHHANWTGHGGTTASTTYNV